MKEGEVICFVKLKQSPTYREKVCKKLYSSDNLKNSITLFVQKQGNHVDVKEIFQEAIIRFFRKAIQEDFSISVSAETYIFGIAKNIYYDHQKSKKEVSWSESIENIDLQVDELQKSPDFEVILESIMQYTTDTCRQVLMYWANNYKMEKIASFMGYKSEMMARKKKHECIKKLSEYLQKNPHIKQNILDHE